MYRSFMLLLFIAISSYIVLYHIVPRKNALIKQVDNQSRSEADIQFSEKHEFIQVPAVIIAGTQKGVSNWIVMII